MIISNDWRLVPSLDAFVVIGSEHKLIYLIAPEKKQYKTAMTKIVGGPYKEIHLDLNEFELKLEMESETAKEPSVFIKNPEFLPSDEWYKVQNFAGNCYEYLLSLPSTNGEFPGCTFEASFSESNPTAVTFSAPGMKHYKEYFEEMKRRLNCELKKKTKKWVPGNRYDTLEKSYIYLGEVLSRKESDIDSPFLEDAKMVPVHLCISNVKDSEKTIADVFKTRTFGDDEDDIKVLTTLPSAALAGKMLEGEIGTLSSYWEDMIDNAVSKSMETEEFGYSRITEPKKIFDIFCYQTADSLSYTSNPEWKEKLVNVLHKMTREVLLTTWNIASIRDDMNVSDSNTEEKNVSAIEKNIYFMTGDINTSRYAYYSGLLKAMGIDIKNIILKSLACWNESDLSSTFDSYLKYNTYFKYRKNPSDVICRQRVASSPYKLDVITVESVFGNGELTDTIKQMVDFARNNFGSGVSKYVLYNVGTKSKPAEYATINIQLGDVIKWKGGVKDLSDELKKELVTAKFTQVDVIIDKDREVE